MNALQQHLSRQTPAHLQHWLNDIQQYVLQQISKQTISISDIAYEFALSERQLQRRIRQLTGQSPNVFIRTIRLAYARQLIASGRYGTVQEVAYAVGYKRADYFSNLFEGQFGLKPIQLLRIA